jgi:hypothetical protein
LIIDNVFHKPQGLRTIYFILWLFLCEFFMIVCLVWFSLMTQESEIGMKSSAPGDSRRPGTFFTACTWCSSEYSADGFERMTLRSRLPRSRQHSKTTSRKQRDLPNGHYSALPGTQLNK